MLHQGADAVIIPGGELFQQIGAALRPELQLLLLLNGLTQGFLPSGKILF